MVKTSGKPDDSAPYIGYFIYTPRHQPADTFSAKNPTRRPFRKQSTSNQSKNPALPYLFNRSPPTKNRSRNLEKPTKFSYNIYVLERRKAYEAN